jgi:rhomboid protease GluP
MDSRRMCPHCRAFITDRDRVCPYCNEPVGPRSVERSESSNLLGFIPHGRFNTVIILLINFGLYIATSLFSMNSGRGDAMNIDAQTLYFFGAKYGPAIARGEWWRLVTAGFLHGGLIHILMNSWVLFDLGSQVEEVYGSSRMLVIYFISTVSGFYLSNLFHPGTPSVGASAALFGLLGAMIAILTKHRNSFTDAIRGQYLRWLVMLLVFSLFGNIDMLAHIGGLVGGFAMGWVAGERRLEGTTTEKLWRVAAGFCIVLTAVSFLKMYLWFMQLSD